MLKPATVGVRGTGKLASDDPLAWKELPGWRRFFLEQEYADGAGERLPGVLIVRADGNGWNLVLKDPQAALMLKVCGRTWDEALLLAEAALGDPHAPWESDPYEVNRRKNSRRRS